MTPTPLDRNRLYWVAGSVALAALAYVAFSLWGGWREVGQAVGAMGLAGMALALGLSLVNYGLRFVRWQIYLATLGHRLAHVDSAAIYVAGFALTTTPGKAGEMLRGVFLKTRGVSYVHSTAAFLSERLSDMLAVVVLALLGGAHVARSGVIVGASVAAVGLALLVLLNAHRGAALAQRWLASTRRVLRVGGHLLQMLVQARRCQAPAVLAGTLALAVVAWAAEAWAFHLMLDWMGFELPWRFAFFVYAASMLAGALSFLPGGLGGAELVMVGLLLWAGVPEPQAVAATVLIRLATLWFAVVLGAAAMLLGRRRLEGRP